MVSIQSQKRREQKNFLGDAMIRCMSESSRATTSMEQTTVCVEALEPRKMLSTLHRYQLPEGANPEKVITGLDGSVYVYEQGSASLARLRPHASSFAQVPINAPLNQHFGLVLSGKGDVYFTVDHGIGAYSPKFNRITIIPLPTDPNDIAYGPDGNLWFTEPDANAIGRLTLTKNGQLANGFQVSQFTVPAAAPAGVASIARGPGNDLWFGEDIAGNVGQITLAGGTPVIHEYPLPTRSGHPLGIITGPDKNVWVTEVFGNKIARVNAVTHAITEFTVPTTTSGTTAPELNSSAPAWITSASNKSLYFVERASGKLARITTAGTVTESLLPGGAGSRPTSIFASGKTLFVTESATDVVDLLSLDLNAT